MQISYETVQRVVKEVKEQHKVYETLQLRTLYRLFLKAFEGNSKMPIAGAMGLAMTKFKYYSIRENWKYSTQVFSNILELMPMPTEGTEQDYQNWLIMLEAIVMELHNR